MARDWTIVVGAPQRCGCCWAAIAVDRPVQRITLPGVRGVRLRCVDCAVGPVDDVAVQAARDRVAEEARQRAAREAEWTARGMTPPAPRRSRPRPPQGFTKLSESAGSIFDPKSAAANDRE